MHDELHSSFNSPAFQEERIFVCSARQHHPSNAISNTNFSWWNFIPLQIGYALGKPSNLFFIFISALQQLPKVSPTGRFTTIVPLTIFTLLDIGKNLFETLNRKRLDEVENRQNVDVWNVDLNQWERCESRYLQRGAIIRVRSRRSFPADVVPLALGTQQTNYFHISTASIDGEDKLKEKICAIPSLKLRQLQRANYTENERMIIFHIPQSKPCVIPKENIVRRSSVLRTASSLVCLVVQVGEDCWIRKNINKQCCNELKRSTADSLISCQIIFFLVLLVALLVIVSMFGKCNTTRYSSLISFAYDIITFFIMYNIAIPISIYFFLEMIREAQAIFITNDVHLWNHGHCKPPLVNTCALNADLGSISYMFLDKTGTLTKNRLKFHSFILPNGVITSKLSKDFETLFVAILTCHSLTVNVKSDGKIIADGASADERCIVSEFMFAIVSVNGESMIIRIDNSILNVNVLQNVAFASSTRKSSCIVALNNEIFLIVKGADEVLLPKLCKPIDAAFKSSLSNCSLEGLRGIVYGMRQLSMDEYTEWKSSNQTDTISLENGLQLLGAVNTQDELQDDARETVTFFQAAGVRCFMLTGDKEECAITIGKRVGISKEAVPNIDIEELYGRIVNSIQNFSISDHRFNLLISGDFVDRAENDGKRQSVFAHFIFNSNCLGAIGYRMSPKNKAVFVSLVQQFTHQQKICCAVGDGSNDIAMLKQAHIGIALYGCEGCDAIKASDYALGSFCLLKRLVFYHGQLSMQRTDRFLIASFYKTVLFCLVHFVYQAISKFGTMALFDQVSYALFNVLWSSVAVLSAGIFEAHLSEQTLMQRPKLESCQERRRAFINEFIIAMVQAFWHSCCIILLPFGFLRLSGLNALTFYEFREYFSNLIYTCLILVVNLKILFVDARSIGLINLIGIAVTFVIWIIYLFGYGCLSNKSVLCNLLFEPECLFVILLVVSSSLLFDFSIRIFRKTPFE